MQNLVVLSALILSLISAVSDIRTAKVRNETFIAGVLLGVTMNSAISGWQGAGYSLLGLILPILIFLPLSSNNFSIFGFRGIKIIGMGDVKLFGYVGALVCYPNIFVIIFLTYIFGGVYSIILMLHQRILIERIKYFFSWMGGYFKNAGKHEYVSTKQVKFAPFVFLAVSVYYLNHYFF